MKIQRLTFRKMLGRGWKKKKLEKTLRKRKNSVIN